jgi:hypothetical protein
MSGQAALFPLLLMMTVGNAGCRIEKTSPQKPSLRAKETARQTMSNMKLKLEFEGETLTATLNDNETTRDFVSLLPLTLKMKDLFGREKYGSLPRAIASGGTRQKDYELGQVIYWSPGPDVAIYYKDDGEAIPDPGIIVIGKVDAGIESLNVPGSVNVTLSIVNEKSASLGGEETK